ncbi:MAG TPA: tetratricopeptide repeat protein [Roseiflexaceae bacterium]|nr:tetratricopeptide repeat protein [Roseiflexaceae bacterium]
MKHDASFGSWLTLRRQALRLQRAELANRIGCAAVTLQKIELDERRPSRQLAERLAEQLGIPSEEHELFIRVGRGELAVDRLSPPQPNVAAPTNLPRPTTALTGRAREVEDVKAMLARAEVRLLTLSGAPGVGKTRLALEAASEVAGSFADGVTFVALAPLNDPGHMLAAIAHALGVELSGKQPLGDRLGHYLHARQVLLVLDNFEHMLVAAPQLTQLLIDAPRLKFLITSRVALELSGEHRYIVLPLGVPPAAHGQRQRLTAAEAQERYAAVELFVQRARAVARTFTLTEANLQAVGEICRRLDGLPLAIELAAARAALFTPQELLSHLDDRFTFLTSRARDLPSRHMTLGHAIDWSYNLLTPAEQLLFRRLGVFVGSCTIEAAQAVCNADGAVGNDIVEGIATLAASSLLQRQEGYDGRSRFGMLETVREYALEQLAASGEIETVRQRHAMYYLAQAEAAEREWDRPDEWAWLRRLVAVRENVRAALRWAIEMRDTATALRLNAGLFSFWTTCSALSEARGWLEAALALPHPGDAQELLAAEAKVLNVVGYVAAELGDLAQASACFERGLTLYRALADNRGIAWSLRGCAVVHRLRGEDVSAEQLLDKSLQLCQSSGDQWGIAWSLYALAFLQLTYGDPARAQLALEDALVHLQQQGMLFGVVRTLLALGYARFTQGDFEGAEARYLEALALSRETPLLPIITDGLERLGLVAAEQGRLIRAARLWGAAEALREATGERRWYVFQHVYDRALTTARAQLVEADWVAAWAAGRALPVTQAITEALEDTATPVGSDQRVSLVGSASL